MTAISPWIELSIPERKPARRRPQGLGALIVGVLLASLALSALRVHVTELRYGRAAALQQEEDLQAEQRRLTVEVQARKDPMRLQQLARAQGFVPAEHVIELPLRVHMAAR